MDRERNQKRSEVGKTEATSMGKVHSHVTFGELWSLDRVLEVRGGTFHKVSFISFYSADKNNKTTNKKFKTNSSNQTKRIKPRALSISFFLSLLETQ